MGKYNSTLTRVAPVFERLCAQEACLSRLLKLPAKRHKDFVLPNVLPTLKESNVCFADGKTRKEHALQPPVGLLSYLIRHLQTSGPVRNNSDTHEKRRLLAEGDPCTIRKALDLLRQSNARAKSWHLLEGPTSPDAYIETDDLIVVIEGKRTENGPTTKTTFMEVRHQMLRHLDCAYEICGRKTLVGFFIVESIACDNPQLSPDWVDHCKKTIDPTVLTESLPHRNETEREAIAHAFVGATTWLAVTREFGLPDPTVI